MNPNPDSNNRIRPKALPSSCLCLFTNAVVYRLVFVSHEYSRILNSESSRVEFYSVSMMTSLCSVTSSAAIITLHNVLVMHPVTVLLSTQWLLTSPCKVQSMSKLKYSNKMLSQARVCLWHLKKRPVLSHCTKPHCASGGLCAQISTLPESTQKFIAAQVAAASSGKLGMRWTRHMQLTCLRLMYRSPVDYIII